MTLHNRSLIAGSALIGLLASSGAMVTEARADQQPDGRRNTDTRTDSPAGDAVVKERREAAGVRFIVGDVEGALSELNQVGEPEITAVKIEGRVRARLDVLHQYVELAPGDVLTPGRLARLNRRMSDLPIATRGSAGYDLVDGTVVMRPVFVERPSFYEGPMDWGSVGIRAMFTQDVRLSTSDPLGLGDVWTASVRWARGRPRIGLQVAMPAPSWLPGVLTVEAFRQSQDYLVSEILTTRTTSENRLRGGAMLSDWLTGWLRWEGGGGLDRIDAVNFAYINGALNARTLGDHVAANVSATWYGAGDNRSTTTGELVLMMRSTVHDDKPLLTALAGVALTANDAPLILWPAASSGAEQVAQLRAHRLHEDGLVTGVYGRRLSFGSVEYVHPLPTRLGPSFLGLAGFVDVANASSGLAAAETPLHVDVGTGIRVNASRSGSRIRLDIGYGLQDGVLRVSAGYVQPWGRR
jgi:hypothetical protein